MDQKEDEDGLGSRRGWIRMKMRMDYNWMRMDQDERGWIRQKTRMDQNEDEDGLDRRRGWIRRKMRMDLIEDEDGFEGR